MKVLVAYASRHGATEGIARRLTDGLGAGGFDAEARKVNDVADLRAYGAVVVGGAVYMQHWLRDATAFVTGKTHPHLPPAPILMATTPCS